MHQLRQNHEGEVLDLKSHLEHLSKQLEQAKADMETCSAMLTKELKMEHEAARKREDQQNQAILWELSLPIICCLRLPCYKQCNIIL